MKAAKYIDKLIEKKLEYRHRKRYLRSLNMYMINFKHIYLHGSVVQCSTGGCDGHEFDPPAWKLFGGSLSHHGVGQYIIWSTVT